MNTTRRDVKVACLISDSATEVSTKSVFTNMTLQTSYATSCIRSSKN